MQKTTLERVGLKIGHYTDKTNLTGLTVFVAEKGAEIGIDIRGSSTGSYNTEAYSNPKAATRLVQAIVLSGGSSFGLESIFGVMQYLEEKNVGNTVAGAIIPGITGGVIYDLGVGNKSVRPSKNNGYQAAKAASSELPAEGNVGVGTGATIGKWLDGKPMKGGFGMSEILLPKDILVCAFVVTNPLGDIVNPSTNKFYSEEGQFDLSGRNISSFSESVSPANTTLAVIATNIALNRDQLLKVAEMAQDGMARAIFPVHTMGDGDMVFALASHSGERRTIPNVDESVITDIIGLGAADVLARL